MLGIACQLCAKRPATSHLTELNPDSGTRTELHLCASCIARLELSLTSDPPPIAEVLAKQAALDNSSIITVPQKIHEPESEANRTTCPSCGVSFAEFVSHNRFGCAQCYTAFKEQIEPLLVRYHGSAVHTGRVPSAGRRSEDDLVAKRARLDLALRDAVAAEDYAKAARLRDELRQLDESDS